MRLKMINKLSEHKQIKTLVEIKSATNVNKDVQSNPESQHSQFEMDSE